MNLDLFFISYDEPNAEENWDLLRERFPDATRIHGIHGIRAVYAECMRRSKGEMFYMVDGDNQVAPEFDFSYRPSRENRVAIHVWRCLNPVNDLVYGFGAVKLCPVDLQAIQTGHQNQVDTATSVARTYKVMPQVASVTRFNSSPFHSWRGAFRECVKLASGSLKSRQVGEDEERLEIWCNRGSERPFGKEALLGARSGRSFGSIHRMNSEALTLINDYSWLRRRFAEGFRNSTALGLQ